MEERSAFGSRRWLRTPSWLVLLGFLAIAAYFLITEHRAHVFGVLPFILLLLCPIFHLLLHRGHGNGHSGHGGHQSCTPGDGQ